MHPSRTVLEQLFENAPGFVDRLSTEDADSYEELIARAEVIARELPEDRQIQLLDGHPRIGATPSSVSAESFQEQGYDRDAGTAQLQERLDRLNADYEQRFGFRFVVFVAGRPRSEIADVMQDRLQASRDAELRRGLSDVFAIARDRLTRLQRVNQEAR